MGMKGEDVSQNTMQQSKHANTNPPGEIKQNGKSQTTSKNSKSKHIIKKMSP